MSYDMYHILQQIEWLATSVSLVWTFLGQGSYRSCLNFASNYSCSWYRGNTQGMYCGRPRGRFLCFHISLHCIDNTVLPEKRDQLTHYHRGIRWYSWDTWIAKPETHRRTHRSCVRWYSISNVSFPYKDTVVMVQNILAILVFNLDCQRDGIKRCPGSWYSCFPCVPVRLSAGESRGKNLPWMWLTAWQAAWLG